MIPPTVGRVVWFNLYGEGQQQPLAATIAHVNDDGTVNIGFFDQHGVHKNATRVPLIQEGDTPPAKCFCVWMPYQVGQARKYEQAVQANPQDQPAGANGPANPEQTTAPSA